MRDGISSIVSRFEKLISKKQGRKSP